VRPPLTAEVEAAGPGAEPVATSFPTSGDVLGRGLEIVVAGPSGGQGPQKHSFAFDKVQRWTEVFWGVVWRPFWSVGGVCVSNCSGSASQC
jgi:hypothetical protein